MMNLEQIFYRLRTMNPAGWRAFIVMYVATEDLMLLEGYAELHELHELSYEIFDVRVPA